eukprot:1149787-Pelagomonas_calceolata.AAC.1
MLLAARYEGPCALRRKYFKLFHTSPGAFSLAQPFLRQQLSAQAVFDFLLQNNELFSFTSELLDVLLAGVDQPQADQPNSEGLLA